MLGLQLYFVTNLEIYIPTIFYSFILGVFIVFFLGWFDDVKPLSVGKKLFIQILAASIFIHSGGIITLSSNEIINILISYFWFILIINSLNMLDNMDGLAIGIGTISIMFLVLVSIPPLYFSANLIIIPLGIISIASMFAFWLFNFIPASIFMGDSGSLSIGYILAALTIPSELNSSFGLTNDSNLESFIIFLIPLALLSAQIFDFCFVTISRLIRGMKPYIGGKDHSSHCFFLLGMSEKKAVFSLYLICIFGGVLAVLLKVYLFSALSIFVIYFSFLIILGLTIGILINKNSKLATHSNPN